MAVPTRTRLDEIVDQEYRPAGEHPSALWRALCLRIAERAFRHGVERGAAANARQYYLDTNLVQPAPAKEKWNTTWWGNRRKGERREEVNWPQNWVHGYDGENSRPIYQASEHGAFMYDRRSGTDRRKG
jgi:hypothetical protein